MTSKIEIFFCYAQEDDDLCKELEKHLQALKRQDIIDTWYDREITAGADREKEVAKHLNSAQIILLLLSPDFMNSDYCYSIEMKRAMERHKQREAQVIPILLRPVYWQGTPFGKLQALPTNEKAITSSFWPNRDEAFYNVVEGVYDVIQKSNGKRAMPALTKELYVSSLGSATNSAQSPSIFPIPPHSTPQKHVKIAKKKKPQIRPLKIGVSNRSKFTFVFLVFVTLTVFLIYSAKTLINTNIDMINSVFHHNNNSIQSPQPTNSTSSIYCLQCDINSYSINIRLIGVLQKFNYSTWDFELKNPTHILENVDAMYLTISGYPGQVGQMVFYSNASRVVSITFNFIPKDGAKYTIKDIQVVIGTSTSINLFYDPVSCTYSASQNTCKS